MLVAVSSLNFINGVIGGRSCVQLEKSSLYFSGRVFGIEMDANCTDKTMGELIDSSMCIHVGVDSS